MIGNRLAGLVAFDRTDLLPAALQALQAMHKFGQLVSRDEVLEGLYDAPDAIRPLYSGANRGRLSIRA